MPRNPLPAILPLVPNMPHKIKFGVHTMMWGERLTEKQVNDMLETICQVSAKYGMSTVGIEFGQKIHHIGVDFQDRDNDRANWLAKWFGPNPPLSLKKFRLKLLGFSGRGSLATRVKFCELLQERSNEVSPEYFLIQNWCDNYIDVVKTVKEKLNSCLALHPFRFGPIDKVGAIGKQLQRIDEICETDKPYVQFLPDTAHLWLANHRTLLWMIESVFHDGIIEIPSFGNPSNFPLLLDRIVAIHLKDWKKTYESSLRYYSRGFSELGGGYISKRSNYKTVEKSSESDLWKLRQKIINFEGGFPKWCVVEQDYTVQDPKDSLDQSLAWLFDGQAAERKREPRKIFAGTESNAASDSVSITAGFDKRKVVFVEELHQRSPENAADYVKTLRCLLRYLFGNENIQIGVWEASPRISAMVLLNEGDKIDGLHTRESYEVDHDNCTGIRVWPLGTIESKGEQVELLTAYPGLENSQVRNEFAKKGRDAVLWIPICNSYNFNQIEAGVDVFLNSNDLPRFSPSDDVFSLQYRHKLEAYIKDIVQHIAFTLEKMWGNAAYQIKSELVSEVVECFDVSLMYKTLLVKLRKHFSNGRRVIDGTDYWTWSFFKYEREDNSFIKMNFKEVVPDKDSRPPAQSGEASVNRDIDIRSSWVNVKGNPPTKQLLSVITAPLFGVKRSDDDSNKFRIENFGVLVGKRFSRVFSASDENTIREMLLGFTPILSNRISEERRAKSVRFIRHELGHPISALDRLTDVIQTEMEFKPQVKNKNYPKEWKTYINLLQGIIGSSFFITGENLARARCEDHVNVLTSEIIFPVINQGPSMIDKNLTPGIVKEIEEKNAIRVFYCNRDSSEYFYVTDKLGHYAPHRPILVNKGHLFLVFFNLLSNSLKYSYRLPVHNLRDNKNYQEPSANEEKRVQIDILIKELPSSNLEFPGGLEIIFRDFGQGIHQNDKEFVFEDGARSSEHKDNVLGDGIGLWVTRKIIKNHNGRITLTSHKLPTDFCIRFPKEIFI